MILYDPGYWGFSFAFQPELWNGSILPKAFALAFPATLMALLLHEYLGNDYMAGPHRDNLKMALTTYSAALGTLLTFRINQAYSRYWEALSNIYQFRAQWFNVVSQSFAFCTNAEDKAGDVRKFQQMLTRLMSMLFCAALRQLDGNCEMEIIDTEGFDKEALHFLKNVNDKCEVIMQWIQKLIYENSKTGVIDAPPPIMTRAFAELAQGMFSLANVRKVRDIPFPYPYSQMTIMLLLVHISMTIFTFAFCVDRRAIITVCCFPAVFATTAMYYATTEIDKPFSEHGEHGNHLPISEILHDFNLSLTTFMNGRAQATPEFRMASSSTQETTHLRMAGPDELRGIQEGPRGEALNRFASKSHAETRPRSRTNETIHDYKRRKHRLSSWHSGQRSQSFLDRLQEFSLAAAGEGGPSEFPVSRMRASAFLRQAQPEEAASHVDTSMRGSLIATEHSTVPQALVSSFQREEESVVAMPAVSVASWHEQSPSSTSVLAASVRESLRSQQYVHGSVGTARPETPPGHATGRVENIQDTAPPWHPLRQPDSRSTR